MGFVKYDWGQQDIINKIKIWTKLVTYTINDVITKEHQKHPITTMLKHMNVLAQVNKVP